ncbi:uncharacterized protein DNG_03765 [Cephalotrichum gorgonifer]|uniref:PHD and RING finger domain-containing protein n=1 Tax=Cephalotrichum gorgonifer TaxID=2041049 RepID=A0AAE8STX1_9PEZI|nr:uncharacterized protein DNG_03765 [Cephalotrichum gorgonifer]
MTDPDQCIICLEPLVIQAPSLLPATTDGSIHPQQQQQHHHQQQPAFLEVAAAAAAAESPTTTTTSTEDDAGNLDTNSRIAALDSCDHIIHDACIRLWAQKTNTCPICREQFRKLRVFDGISGSTIECVEIEEKKQVAEFDPHEWLAENGEDEAEEAATHPCPVCNSSEREDVLLLCDGCDAAYHTYCIGLDEVPAGDWYCMECADTLEQSQGRGVRRANPRQRRTTAPSRSRSRPFPRTRERMRQARRQARALEWAGPWVQFTGRVYDALQIDLDNHEDDDALAEFRVAQLRREREAREVEIWQQRIDIANRLGAGEIFANSLPMSARQQLQHHPEPQPPVQQTRDEIRSWGALDRARIAEESSSSQNSRKRRAPTASPVEPSEEPERKLKRPRTRRFLPAPASAQAEASGSNTAPAPADQAMENSSLPQLQEAPSFLSSLLKEVGVGTPSDDENVKSYLARAAPDATSPGSSPSPSVHNSPRALSLTPPPMCNGRPSSPPLSLSSYIEPRYPRANYSPTRQHSASPSRQSSRDRQSDIEKSPEPNPGNTRTLEIRQPRPRRPQLEEAARSIDASSVRDQLSPEAKASISGIVRTALKPHWHAKELTTEQYSVINRDVSRKLYEEIKDPSALDGDGLKRWETVASNEVAQAVAEAKS